MSRASTAYRAGSPHLLHRPLVEGISFKNYLNSFISQMFLHYKFPSTKIKCRGTSHLNVSRT